MLKLPGTGHAERAVLAEREGVVRCWEESRLKKELVTCQSPEIRRTGQLVRRLDKHHFDQGTPACWISAYFLTQ